MIGVLSRPEQAALVEEFFQLFKTPWEFWRPGRAYDAVVASTDRVPDLNARLVIIYGSALTSADADLGIGSRSRNRGGWIEYRGQSLPIHEELLAFQNAGVGVPLATAAGAPAALRFETRGTTMIRVGYDLFAEIEFLLSIGQPVEAAHVPAVDIHITILRDALLDAGLTLVEIPPAPAASRFVVCLTHDIDFVGIRQHKFDHTMWGFLYRSTFGSLKNVFRRRCTARRLFRIWRALASLPFVLMGWVKDFWSPFEWYLRVEKHLPSTYFLIPFKGRPGEHVEGRYTARRAAAYDITDLPHWTKTLLEEGCELGVHGIDAWHSVPKGREELARVAAVTGESKVGIRMHWLLRNDDTFRVLERAGYAYDSTAGYNETIGYRSGTTQVFRPPAADVLLELPLHIQDGALFYPHRLDLSESAAWTRCVELIDNAERFGGVLTVLWHDRSHGPERFWGDFYVRLVEALKSRNAWFATAAQAVGWFQKRRDVRFEEFTSHDGVWRARVNGDGEEAQPPLTIRIHRPRTSRADRSCDDIAWNGRTTLELSLGSSLCAAS